MRFFDFLEKLRMEKKDVFEENIAKIRYGYLSKIEEEITKYGWERTTILKQLFDWYTEPIAGEIRDTSFSNLYLSVKKDLTKLSQRIRLMQPTVKKKQKKENPNSDKETTLIPILIRSNYNHEKEIEHKKQIIVKNNEKISKNFSLDWAKKYAKEKIWKTDGFDLDEQQEETVNQIRKDINRNGNNPPLIYALKTIAQNPPKNYSFGQDDVLYLEWLLQRGLINLSSNLWMDEILPEFAVLWSVAEKACILSAGALAIKYINEKTIKNLVNNLKIRDGERGDALRESLKNLNDDPDMLDSYTAQATLSDILQKWPLLTKCADFVLSHVFIHKRKITSEILLRYILDDLRIAGQSQQKKKKLKK